MSYQLEWTYKTATCVATGEIIDRDTSAKELTVMFTGLVLSGVWPNEGTVTKAKAALPTRDPKTYFVINSSDNIKSIDVSNLDTSKVTDMCGMFEDCTYLEHLDISGLDVSKVITMESMFRDCTYLKSVNLPTLTTTSLTNMDEMFHRCTSLISLDFSDWDTSKVTVMRSAFAECSANIYLPVSASLTLYDTIHYRGTGNLYIFGDNNKVAEICGAYPDDVFPITYPTINSCSIGRADDDKTKVIFSIECTTTFNKKNALNNLIIIKSPNKTQTCEYTTTTNVVNDTTKYSIDGYIDEDLSVAKAGEYSVYVTDTLGRTSNVFKVTVMTESTVISIKENSGITFGETCEDDGFTCAFDAKFKGNIQQVSDENITFSVNSDGDVRSGGDIYAHCESDSSGGVSLSSITNGTATIKFTKGGISTELTYSQCGYVVSIWGVVKATSDIATGANMVEGTVTGIPKPAKKCRFTDYYGNHIMVTAFTPAGELTTRHTGSAKLSSGSTAGIAGTYITDGTML